jgi:hypothetical protein
MFLTNFVTKLHIPIFNADVLKAELRSWRGHRAVILYFTQKCYLNPICFFFEDLLLCCYKISPSSPIPRGASVAVTTQVLALAALLVNVGS